ncbi:MAG: hypothetical protein A2Y41_12540 [Spirochaetes bacterium GWB1_36_13]|nr:MAG: hypothetical protein A2Y41_12540 [Spirochaetes bacterium GWB1_36_13]
MLIEYNFSNFKSFKESNTFSMVGVPSFKELETDNILELGDSKILKTATIYGNNASGKSNFVDSLRIMKTVVTTSFRDALVKEQHINIENFLLNTKTEKSASSFEVTFICDKIKYRYGFEIDNGKITKEWLFHTTTKETALFKRENNIFTINKTSFKEGINLESKTRDNVLFLSLVAQFNGNISNNIINWFNNVNFISGLYDIGYADYTVQKLKNDNNFSKWLSAILKTLEISNISIEERDIVENDINKLINNTNDEKLAVFLKNAKKMKISTWHKKYDENNLLVDTIPFDFNKQESEGTKKFVYLLGSWYDTLKNGKILIVDELDSRLHHHLTKKLIEFFHKHNNNFSQLIFSSHNILLLDKDLFRRDQIWFTEKNQFGASELYSLADFKAEKVRNTSAYYKNYINGKYGATSFFDIDKFITDLLQNA